VVSSFCQAVFLQLRHISTIRKKLVKQQYIFSTSPQYGELRPTNGLEQFRSLGHPSKFQRVSRLDVVSAATLFTGGQANFARCLPSPGLLRYIYTFSGAFAPWWNFARCKVHFASKCCVLLCWHRYCTAHQQQASAKLCGLVLGMEEWNYRTSTFTEGATCIRLDGITLSLAHILHRVRKKNGPA